MGNDGIPPMMGGCGENSYFCNSTYQRKMYESIKEFVRNAVQANFDISPGDSNVIRIADLGCSVGPNTFYAVQSIIDAMCSTPSISQLAPAIPEFQVFFNDQIGNDFNMLFNSLPLLDCRYFVAGAPGSFYGRIFPTASIHFFNSAMALHWLSKAPVGASNKGRIHYYGGGPSVQAAYMTQFQADMRAFLESRAEELVEGGLLSLLLVGKKIWGQISLPINFWLKLWSLYSKSLYLRSSTSQVLKREFKSISSWRDSLHSPTFIW